MSQLVLILVVHSWVKVFFSPNRVRNFLSLFLYFYFIGVEWTNLLDKFSSVFKLVILYFYSYVLSLLTELFLCLIIDAYAFNINHKEMRLWGNIMFLLFKLDDYFQVKFFVLQFAYYCSICLWNSFSFLPQLNWTWVFKNEFSQNYKSIVNPVNLNLKVFICIYNI